MKLTLYSFGVFPSSIPGLDINFCRIEGPIVESLYLKKNDLNILELIFFGWSIDFSVIMILKLKNIEQMIASIITRDLKVWNKDTIRSDRKVLQ